MADGIKRRSLLDDDDDEAAKKSGTASENGENEPVDNENADENADGKNDAVFINEYEITEKLFIDWARSPVNPRLLRPYRAVWLAAFIICAAGCVFTALSGAWLLVVMLAAGAAVSAVWYFCGITMAAKKQYKNILSDLGSEKWSRKLYFTENRVITEDNGEDFSYPYDRFTGRIENEDHYVILLDENTGIRVYKNAFTKGSFECFPDFILEKCKGKSKEKNSEKE